MTVEREGPPDDLLGSLDQPRKGNELLLIRLAGGVEVPLKTVANVEVVEVFDMRSTGVELATENHNSTIVNVVVVAEPTIANAGVVVGNGPCTGSRISTVHINGSMVDKLPGKGCWVEVVAGECRVQLGPQINDLGRAQCRAYAKGINLVTLVTGV
jgi:hypothetical protein